MKIAVILGAFSVGTRPITFSNFWSNERGATGTDLAFMRVSEELSSLGHTVELFTVKSAKDKTYKQMRIRDVSDIKKIDKEGFDAVINFNEPNLFIGMKKPFKLLYMMLNDFSFVEDGFDEWTDQYVGVCPEHTRYMQAQCPKPEKWKTVALGCDPDKYKDERVPGRVIWCSSADRGLHWLLSIWSEIKEAVPEASLRVLYHFNYEGIFDIEGHHISPQGTPYNTHTVEMANRVRYIRRAMAELKDLDVEHLGSVSRDQIVEEWNKASVFGFTCDTVAYSEGFSVSTLEAHASYTLPIITSQDCLGGIYKDSGCIMIDAPIKDHLDEYKSAIISQLKDIDITRVNQCREFAKKHTWKLTAKRLETLIKKGTNE